MLPTLIWTEPWSLAARILLVQELHKKENKKTHMNTHTTTSAVLDDFYAPLSWDVKVYVLSGVVLHFKG
jgi:hypothetical protein